jgi:hypothetical protein
MCAHREQVCILEGIAGKGKSTVAQTVAVRSGHTLGASFFFARDVDRLNTAKDFFTTIAYQLALTRIDFANAIGKALESAPDAPTKTLHEQFRRLVLEPLHHLCPQGILPTVIVIDALDECEKEESKTVLRLILQEIHRLPSFKVFITTRPEPHVLDIATNPRYSTNHFRLNITKFDAERDLQVFLRSRLSFTYVQEKLPNLEPGWGASDELIMSLAHVVGKLFIVAATVVTFILDCDVNDPEHQAEALLQNFDRSCPSQDNPYHSLDTLYNQILDLSIPPRSQSVVTKRFQDIVGAIIVLQDPLALQPLANLLNVKSGDLKNTLRSLHSVINSTPETEPLRVYHASFPDFIVDSVRCARQELVIVTSDQHRRLAFRCFDVMKTLKVNICDLKDSEKYNKKAAIPDLQERVKEKIPPELDYSCRYWAVHVVHSNTVDEKLFFQLRYFVYTHLLHWLEVLSLIGKLDIAYRSLEHIRRMESEVSNQVSL